MLENGEPFRSLTHLKVLRVHFVVSQSHEMMPKYRFQRGEAVSMYLRSTALQ